MDCRRRGYVSRLSQLDTISTTDPSVMHIHKYPALCGASRAYGTSRPVGIGDNTTIRMRCVHAKSSLRSDIIHCNRTVLHVITSVD
ncbi:hypothetical protein C8Q80DRAFT_1211961 [Daedaleopsis nitida]|nr:hypothetical protein C8Q80DRAFT_1211961 [Daedaleopsis nitida]